MNVFSRRLAQAVRATHELGPALRALGRAARTAARPDAAEPDVAVLDAPPVCRDGAPASVHVRIVNPGRARRTIAVAVEGGPEHGPAFHAGWHATIEAGAAEERWIVTTWRGDAESHAVDPALPVAWAIGEPTARWRVTARAGERPPLVIAGALVR